VADLIVVKEYDSAYINNLAAQHENWPGLPFDTTETEHTRAGNTADPTTSA